MNTADAMPKSHFPTSPASMNFTQYLTCKDTNLSCQFFIMPDFLPQSLLHVPPLKNEIDKIQKQMGCLGLT